MATNSQIVFYNRYTKNKEVEKVMGDTFIFWLYNSFLGRIVEKFLSSWSLPSKVMGFYYSSKLSRKIIKKFINDFSIDETKFRRGSLREKDFADSFSSFNEFFTRDFIYDSRTFVIEKNLMPAPAEGRYFATESLHEVLKFPVKGTYLNVEELLSISEYEHFIRGPLLIARLCPVDYHKYHYPDDGNVIKSYMKFGNLHSVNPIALKQNPKIFLRNERRISILETKNFGKLAYIEVGALGVGAIEQIHNEKTSFARGEIKGQFLFGGSTVMIIGEKGRWSPSDDLLDQSYNGFETFIKLGDTVARA